MSRSRVIDVLDHVLDKGIVIDAQRLSLELGVPVVETMMVASHKYDLRAAARLGCQSAFVARPLELGVGGAVDIAYEDEFDINASDFTDLADQLGC